MIAIPDPPIASARYGMRLLRSGLNRGVLRVLAVRSMGVGDLCAALMLESDTSLREQLGQLATVGVIERREDVEISASAGEFRLTRAGEDLLGVMRLAAAWLMDRPGSPLNPESEAAWRAVAALGDAWERSLIQHLLLRPSTRPELLETIPDLSREKAKRMLRRLQGAGLLRTVEVGGTGVRFVPTRWARTAIAVLAAVARWERNRLPGMAEPVTASDGAIALLGALPLVEPPTDAAGIGTFAVESDAVGATPRTSGVWARFAGGRVTRCSGGHCPSPPDVWVHGGIDAWLDAVIDGRPTALRLGGDLALAKVAIGGLHEVLFEDPAKHFRQWGARFRDPRSQ